MKKSVLLLPVLSLVVGCSLGVPVDRTGNATCRSNGLVVFSGTVTMTGESLVEEHELPRTWIVKAQDVTCEFEFRDADLDVK